MRIGRTILVALLAMAIAVLPARVGFAAGAAAATELAVTQAMPDCEHHQHHNAPADKTQKPAHDAACLAACAAISGFTAADVSSIAYAAPEAATLKPMHVGTALASLMGSPPFRPPRA